VKVLIQSKSENNCVNFLLCSTVAPVLSSYVQTSILRNSEGVVYGRYLFVRHVAIKMWSWKYAPASSAPVLCIASRQHRKGLCFAARLVLYILFGLRFLL